MKRHVCLITSVGLLIASISIAQGSAELLFTLDRSAALAKTSSSAITDAAEVFVIDLEPALVAQNPPTLWVELPGDRLLEAHRDHFFEYRQDWMSWSGRLQVPGTTGHEGWAGELQLVYHGDHVTAVLNVEGEQFQIVRPAGGRHQLVRLEKTDTVNCGLSTPDGVDPLPFRSGGFPSGTADRNNARLARERVGIYAAYR